MEYKFQEIEKKWQQYWNEHATYKVEIDESRPKFYVLDMFPYPSGAGLHVGHPLGYIASDIYSSTNFQRSATKQKHLLNIFQFLHIDYSSEV